MHRQIIVVLTCNLCDSDGRPKRWSWIRSRFGDCLCTWDDCIDQLKRVSGDLCTILRVWDLFWLIMGYLCHQLTTATDSAIIRDLGFHLVTGFYQRTHLREYCRIQLIVDYLQGAQDITDQGASGRTLRFKFIQMVRPSKNMICSVLIDRALLACARLERDASSSSWRRFHDREAELDPFWRQGFGKCQAGKKAERYHGSCSAFPSKSQFLHPIKFYRYSRFHIYQLVLLDDNVYYQTGGNRSELKTLAFFFNEHGTTVSQELSAHLMKGSGFH